MVVVAAQDVSTDPSVMYVYDPSTGALVGIATIGVSSKCLAGTYRGVDCLDGGNFQAVTCALDGGVVD
jgi:hypothetical protein